MWLEWGVSKRKIFSLLNLINGRLKTVVAANALH